MSDRFCQTLYLFLCSLACYLCEESNGIIGYMKNMKKKVLLAGMSLLVMTMVCYDSFHEEKIESALLMENIEALVWAL